MRPSAPQSQSPERSVAEKLDAVHPQMLRCEGETNPQQVGELLKRVIGRVIEQAILRSGLMKQEVAFAMGYSDSGVIGRWINGTETPQFARLWAVEALRQPLAIELAALSGAKVHVHVEFPQEAAG